LWGRPTWNYADFSNTNFRLKIDANNASWGGGTLWLDSVAAKVYYTPNTPPSSPVLSSPSDGTLTNDNTPYLEWGASTDTEGNSLNYGFEISTASDFSSIALTGGTAGTALQVADVNALPDGTYYWRVVANDGFSNGDWSAVWSFTVDTTNPATSFSISGGTVGDNGWYKGPIAPTVDLTTEEGATIYWRWDSDEWNSGPSVQNPSVADGIHTLEYYSVDSVSNEETPHNFETVKYDSLAPVITMNGVTPVKVTYGDSYFDDGATALDNNDGDLTGSIVTTSNVDILNVGNYTVKYDVTDEAGNVAQTVTRDVEVVKKKITVTADNYSKVAGSADPTLTYKFTPSLVGSDVFTGTIARASGETAGLYQINQGTLALSDNYDLVFVNGVLTIAAAPVAPVTNFGAGTGASDTAVLGTQTTNKDNKNNDKSDVKGSTDEKSDPGFLMSTWLGIHNWVWLLLAAAGIGGGMWWLLGYRRRRDEE
jgi:hypothetical protein